MAKIDIGNVLAGAIGGLADIKQAKQREARRKEAEKKAEAEKQRARTDQANAVMGAVLGRYLSQYPNAPFAAYERQAQVATGQYKPPQTFGAGYPQGHDEYFNAEGLQGTPDPKGLLAGLPDLGESTAQRTERLARESAARTEAAADKRFKQTMRRDRRTQNARVGLEKLKSAAQLERERLRVNPKLAKDKGDYVVRMLKAYDDLGGNPLYRDEEARQAAEAYDTFLTARVAPPPVSPGRAVVEQFKRDTGGGLADPFSGARPRTSEFNASEWLQSLVGPDKAAPTGPGMPPLPMPVPAETGMPSGPMGAVPPPPTPPSPKPGVRPTAEQRFPNGTVPGAKLQNELAGAYAREKQGDLAGARAADVPRAAKDRERRTDSTIAHQRTQDELGLARHALDEKEFTFDKWHKNARLGLDRLKQQARHQESARRNATTPEDKALYREWSAILTQINGLEKQAFSFQGGRERKREVAGEIQERVEELRERADSLRAQMRGGEATGRTVPPKPKMKPQPVPGAELRSQYPGTKTHTPSAVKAQIAVEVAEYERRFGRKPSIGKVNEISSIVRSKLRVPPTGTGGY